MAYCDAHMHFDLESDNPIEDLKEYIRKFHIQRGILILNTRRELELFQEYFEGVEEYQDILRVVVGINKNEDYIREGYELCKRLGQLYMVKLHPRLYGITEETEDWYMNILEEKRPDVIVIDDFFYGDWNKPDYVMQFITRVAQKFQESKIVVAHSGGVDLLRHVMFTKVHKNVFYDLSLTCNYLKETTAVLNIPWELKYLPKRVMLGSDYPDYTIGSSYKICKDLLEGGDIDKDVQEQFFCRTLYDVYGK